MTVPQDVNGFVSKLERKIAWRKKEILDLAALAAAAPSSSAARRAGVCLFYAHWEGFVRDAIALVLDHIRTTVEDEEALALSIRAAILLEYVNRNKDSFGLQTCADFLNRKWFDDFGLLELPSVGRLSGNVSYGTFSALVGALNFPVPTQIELKKLFIDADLMERRNKIAHGFGVPVEDADFIQTKENVLELLTFSQTMFIDGVLNERFRQPSG